MGGWLLGIWNEIKPNAKWDFIKWIFGGGVLATAVVLVRAASLYWRSQVLIFVCCVLGFALVALYQRSRKRLPVLKSGQSENLEVWRNPRLALVTGHTFANTLINVDGKSFRDCSFENVTFMFHGTAPAEFVGTNQMKGAFSFSTDHPVAMLYSKLQRFARAIPDAQIVEGQFDDKGRILADNFKIEPVGTSATSSAATSAILPLSPLQTEALQLSTELLDFIKRLGPPPAPKYTAADIELICLLLK